MILSREQGKPLDGPNARFEVGACAAWTRNAADTPLEPEVVFEAGESRAEVHYDPALCHARDLVDELEDDEILGFTEAG